MSDKGHDKEDQPAEEGIGTDPTQSEGSHWADDSGIVEDEIEAALKLIGTSFDGKYYLVRLLGQGGMGAVYEAEHAEIGNTVAIKVLFPGRRKGETLARFKREARAAGTIGHPNIVRVFDMDKTSDGVFYLVMEYVEGDSLAQMIAVEKKLEPGRVVDIAVQVLEALEAAHEHGIVHRDVKPENVMISVDQDDVERARVLDFGISKIRPTGSDVQGLTQSGVVLGTPLFMAPEQARGEPDIDHRIDLYAVGTLMYIMLSGRNPFQASNYNALLAKILTEKPPPVEEVCPEIEEHLAAVVNKAMCFDRADRFQSAKDFIDALGGRRSIVAPSRELAFEDEEPDDRQRRFLVAAIAVVAVLLLGLAVLFGTDLLTEGATMGDERRTASVASLGDRDATPSATSDADQHDVTKRDGAVSSGDASNDGAITDAGDPTKIVVHIETIPGDARIEMNGTPVANPFTKRLFRTESETLDIRVTAKGYRALRKTYPRTEDIDEQFVLESAPVLPKKGRWSRGKRGNFKTKID